MSEWVGPSSIEEGGTLRLSLSVPHSPPTISNLLYTFCTLRLSGEEKLCKSNKNLRMTRLRDGIEKKTKLTSLLVIRESRPTGSNIVLSEWHHGVEGTLH